MSRNLNPDQSNLKAWDQFEQTPNNNEHKKIIIEFNVYQQPIRLWLSIDPWLKTADITEWSNLVTKISPATLVFMEGSDGLEENNLLLKFDDAKNFPAKEKTWIFQFDVERMRKKPWILNR